MKLLKEDRYLKNVLANPNINDELLDILSEDEFGMVFIKARKIKKSI